MPLLLLDCTATSTACRFRFGESRSSRQSVGDHRPMAERRHLAFIFGQGFAKAGRLDGTPHPVFGPIAPIPSGAGG